MKGYIKLRKRAMDILISKLPVRLYYHDVAHTLDVLKVCNQYIKRQEIKSESAKLLRLAALMHDIGFTVSNIDHEERGVEIALELMKEYGFSQDHISCVARLIRATKIPQQPKDQLERVICDADLDYLGRKDFFEISNKLYKELRAYSIVRDKEHWHTFQLEFLEAHSFHTEFAKQNRQPQKEEHIQILKERGASG